MSTPDTGEYHVFALVAEIEQSKFSIYFIQRAEDMFFDPKKNERILLHLPVNHSLRNSADLSFVPKYCTGTY